MWLRRAIALSALAVVTLAVVMVARRPNHPAPASSAKATPSATPHQKARRRKAALPPVFGEISGAKARAMAVPILMYHVISKAPPGVANPELWVDQDVFADEMRALAAA